MLEIFVDADGCPVKQETYKVAERYALRVKLVANSWMRTPPFEWLELVIVRDLFDAADDWIVEHVTADDIVISGDIILASRCLPKGAHVLSPRGGTFDEADIGAALANRELYSHLRDLGTITKGPAPFDQRDRSRYLQRLDQVIQSIRRQQQRDGR
ncbi:MAG: YaiI/YqxD family protein [Planctomycetota bacterium]